jgi:predicted transcriptional regulator
MPTTEQRAKHKRVRTNIQRYILDTVAATGILAVSLVVPNMSKILFPYMRDLTNPDRTNEKIKRAFYQLLKNGEIVIKQSNGKKFVEITDKGRMKLYKLYSLAGKGRKQRWDKRWRIVVYDIRETQKAIRMRISELLKGYGFFKLQASVWVYPYPCEELITLLKSELKTGKQLLYAIVEELEYDDPIRKHFELP